MPIDLSSILAALGGLVAIWAAVATHEAVKLSGELSAQKVAYVQAQKDAQAQAQKAHDEAEALFKKHSEEADHAYKIQLAEANDATARYIAAHRLPAAAKSTGGGSASAPEDRSAGLPPVVPAGSVLVSQQDMYACTGAATYSLKAYNWAMGLNSPK